MKKGTKNNTLANATVETNVVEPQVESLAGTDVTPADAPASAEALEKLKSGSKEILGNAIKDGKKSFPVYEDDKASLPMGKRNGYYTSCPIYLPKSGDYVEGYLKVAFFGEESPKIGVSVTTKVKDPFTSKMEDKTSWRNYAITPEQESYWSQLTNSKVMLAFITSLVISGDIPVIEFKRR